MNFDISPDTWLCFYGLKADPEDYARFDLVVFDGTFHPDLARKRDGGPVILGYLSAAEVLEHGPFWPRVEGRNILVRKKPFWDSWVLDIRDQEWQDLLVQEAFPGILEQGFDGVFLDTLDSALALELWTDEPRFRGTQEAVIRLMETLRHAYPDAVTAVNRGLPVLPGIAGFMDFLVVEGLSSIYQGPESGYVPVGPETQDILLSQLDSGLGKFPKLPVLTLDYAPEGKPDLVRDAINFSRKKGFIPYVSTVKLDRIYTHTLDDDLDYSGPLPRSGGRNS